MKNFLEKLKEKVLNYVNFNKDEAVSSKETEVAQKAEEPKEIRKDKPQWDRNRKEDQKKRPQPAYNKDKRSHKTEKERLKTTDKEKGSERVVKEPVKSNQPVNKSYRKRENVSPRVQESDRPKKQSSGNKLSKKHHGKLNDQRNQNR
jgi:hypothetical protein